MDAGEPSLAFEPRDPCFAHLRTPEILVQPAVGTQFPAYSAWEGGGYSLVDVEGGELIFSASRLYRVQTFKGEIPPAAYWMFDSGMVEVIVPYKTIGSSEFSSNATGTIVFAPFLFTFGFFCRVPFYVAHDVLKTAMIPVAASFYAMEPG